MTIKILYQGHYWCIYMQCTYLPCDSDDILELEYFLPISRDAKSCFDYLVKDGKFDEDTIIKCVLEHADRYNDDSKKMVDEDVIHDGAAWHIFDRYVDWNVVRKSFIDYERNKCLDLYAKSKSNTVRRLLKKAIWAEIT